MQSNLFQSETAVSSGELPSVGASGQLAWRRYSRLIWFTRDWLICI